MESILEYFQTIHGPCPVVEEVFPAGPYFLVEIEIPENPVACEDPEKAIAYSRLCTPFPAIILDKCGIILDGVHRLNAAHLRGDKTILAYVPEGWNGEALLEVSTSPDQLKFWE